MTRIGLALALASFSSVAGAADDVAIKVCVGQSCFSAFSAGFDVTVLSDDGGSGGGASKPVFSVVSVVKATDGLSPNLLRWTAAGTFFPQVVVTVTPRYQLPYTITLNDASIIRFSSAADLGTTRETVDFRYGEVCVASGGTVQCNQVL
jgi:type VI protein secretion system component Hcp